VHLKAD